MWCSVSRGAAQEETRIAIAVARANRPTMSILTMSILPTIKSEEFLCRCRGCASDFFQGNAAGASDLFRDQSCVGRLAAFSAKRDRRQIWAICFDHETVHRDFRCDFANLFSSLERYDSSERNEMAKIENFIRLIEGAAKTVKNTADLAAVIAQNFQGVVPSVALMHYDVEAQFDREIEQLLE